MNEENPIQATPTPSKAAMMSKLAVPGAIVLAGIIVAGAIYMTKAPSTGIDKGTDIVKPKISLRAVTNDDHILGSPNADIFIVEYSDTECPFCKRFHVTLQSLMNTYGKDGKVAWVYRHFPLVQLHKKAPKEAEATECAAELGGKTAFWDYINRIYEITPANDGLATAKLYDIAKELKLDTVKFKNCLDTGKYAEKVQADYDDAVSAGGRGTPHSVIVLAKPMGKILNQIVLDVSSKYGIGATYLFATDDRSKIVVSGAQDINVLKDLIDGILKAQ